MVKPGILGKILCEIFDDEVIEIRNYDNKKNIPSPKERHTPIYQENWS